jgi:hypothetical protein
MPNAEMRQRRAVSTACVLTLLFGVAPSRAQTAEVIPAATIPAATIPAATIPAATVDALHALSQMAAVIFSGQVTAIRRQEPDGGIVEVEFAVEDAVRGVNGDTYTLREWSGLWTAENEPFRVGQRYLMLLHAPGRAGLSSPVGGTDGAIPILGVAGRGSGSPEPAEPAVAASSATDGRMVDLRWVAARVARTVSYAAEPVARPTSQPVVLLPNAHAAQVDVTSPSPSVAAASGGAAYSAVLAALRSWELTGYAAR